jgi:hypothetical protein
VILLLPLLLLISTYLYFLCTAGRENDELPETLFGCVGINKPQEERGEFIFPEDQIEDEE